MLMKAFWGCLFYIKFATSNISNACSAQIFILHVTNLDKQQKLKEHKIKS